MDMDAIDVDANKPFSLATLMGIDVSEQPTLPEAPEEPSGKKRRSSVVSHDIRSFFDGTKAAPAPTPCRSGGDFQARSGEASKGNMLAAFKLVSSAVQMVSESALSLQDAETGQSRSILSSPVTLSDMRELTPLLVAPVALLPSGQAIFGQLPSQWLDVSGRSDALGTRCLFASRRHEHSVYEHLPPEQLLRVPCAASEWQPHMNVPSASEGAAVGQELADEEPWAIQIHPARKEVRVLIRPGAMLQRMLRRGTALPAAKFTWRVVEASGGVCAAEAGAEQQTSAAIGEFSILSNIEDAAHTQPPHFVTWPLRREQLRSLGWMISQEQRRREPFITELREAAPCLDAPHWRLEGCLRCEYQGVKGGVLADAIGYGKTACTIGLIDCTKSHPLPSVPPAFAGFIPSRATLILAPTNLHSQWLAEIKKFTGETLKVLSVPTCTQLKRLTLQDLVDADVVVATYRLFYSTPYLRRLQEVARGKKPGFVFPRLPGGQSNESSGSFHSKADWTRAYRNAFEALPSWTSGLPDVHESRDARAPTPPISADPITPMRGDLQCQPDADATDGKRSSQKHGKKAKSAQRRAEKATDGAVSMASPDAHSGKKRRIVGKQAVDGSSSRADVDVHVKREVEQQEQSTCTPEVSTHFVPLEAFWWRRVVCDEFHELISRYPPAQVAVELFHGDYKWGLSGTPPCQTLQQIRKAAGFLGVQLPTAACEESGGEAPRRVAQEWLDAFVRRNTAELPALDEEEQIVPVHQTPKERALYVALTEQHSSALQLVETTQTQMVAEQGLASADLASLELMPEVQAARRSASGLLKLCSHFCMSSTSDVVTAEDECQRQLSLRRERLSACDKQAKTLAERAVNIVKLVRHFEPHFGRIPQRADYGFILKEPRAAIAARLRFLGVSMVGTKAELLTRLLGPATGASEEGGGAVADATEAAKQIVLSADFDLKRAKRVSRSSEPAAAWLSLQAAAAAAGASALAAPATGREMVLSAVRKAISAEAAAAKNATAPQQCAKLRVKLGMPRAPAPLATPGSEARQQRQAELEEANVEWLKDHQNGSKLRGALEAWKADLETAARQLLALQTEAGSRLEAHRSFSKTLTDTQVAAAESSIDEDQLSTAPFAKYGSKIEALVKHVQKLQAEDASCKVICFVQWEDLKRKISAALIEFGLEHMSLHGSVWARRAVLTKFQYDEGSPKMLLLSLEESASGTNLTAANHVIIVHPMEAATREEAVAFEMQAVGRVRRPGQQRRIHIWRFVTIGTIEQDITEGHQRELWERQQVKISVSQSQPDPIAGDLAAEDLREQDFEEDGALENSWDQGHDLATQRYLNPVDSVAFPAMPPQSPSVAGKEAEDETLVYDRSCGHAAASDENATQAYFYSPFH